MDYVSIPKLQSKLAGVANHSTVRKLIDKMEQDGYIKNTGNRRLGKQLKMHTRFGLCAEFKQSLKHMELCI